MKYYEEKLVGLLVSHGRYPATRSVTIKRTGKQDDLGLFKAGWIKTRVVHFWIFYEGCYARDILRFVCNTVCDNYHNFITESSITAIP